MMVPARFPLAGAPPQLAAAPPPQTSGAPPPPPPLAPLQQLYHHASSVYGHHQQHQQLHTSSYYGCYNYNNINNYNNNNNNNNDDWNNYCRGGYGETHRDFAASHPDNLLYGSYYCSTASSPSSSSASPSSSSASPSSSSASPSSASPMSSSASPMSSASPPSSSAASYRQYFSPNQTHDCHGVPAHPSVADFTTLAQYHQQQHLRHQEHPETLTPRYAQQQQQQLLLVQSLPQQQLPPPQHNNNNNNNNYYSSSYEDAAGDYVKNTGNNSSRQMRNLAEKQRRNKLNTCINELSQLVPLISNASKKIEKTSVLRLSAAYLRLSRLLMGLKEQREEMPVYIKEVNLADLLLDDRDIFLMVTSAGKIVFVSHSVEHILGHPQIDLMGQSLFGIACPEDHDELRKNLQFKDETFETKTDVSADDDPAEIAKLGSGCKMQRRSFYMRLVKKAVSRGEQPELKLVHVVGTLMMYNGSKNPLVGGNEVVLNAVVRPYNERRVTEVSMLEATREEYITRHQIDGRIIYVDHRISIVSGFMPQEVSGQLAFTYMHKEDVRWVMIALRQMYFKGLSYGSSCYRLLSKNGEFVYMKTYGYLELNSNEDKIGSFICVNTLVSEKEGKLEIKKMKERFTPLIRSQSEPGIAAITAITNNNISEEKDPTLLDDSESNCYTEDLTTLNKFVEQMIINIPKPAIDNVKETAQNPGPLPDSQYAKVALLSKSMPPVPTTSSIPKIEKQLSVSPQPKIKPPTQDRPSVLRVAPRKPVVILNPSINEQSTEKDREYFERRGGILVVPKRHNDQQIPEHSPKKAKIVLESQVDSPTTSQYSNQMDSLQSDNQLSTDSYSSLDGLSSFQSTPIQPSLLNANELSDSEPLINMNTTDFNHFTDIFDDNVTLLNPVLDESYNSYDNVICNDGSSTDIISQDSLQEERSVESELLIKQIKIQSNIDQQKSQLKEIQTKLHSLPSNADTHYLKTDFTNLQAEYEKHEQILRSIQQQGVHQNIGV